MEDKGCLVSSFLSFLAMLAKTLAQLSGIFLLFLFLFFCLTMSASCSMLLAALLSDWASDPFPLPRKFH